MKLTALRSMEAKNALWIIGGKVAQMVLSLLVSIWSARYLGPSNFGTINYANALIGFFMSFCTLGLQKIAVKDFLENPDEQGTALGSVIFMRTLSSVCSCIMVICVSFVMDFGDWETVAVVALSSISLVCHAFDSIGYWFQSQLKSKVNTIASLTAYIVVTIYKIVLLILGKSVLWFAFANSLDYIVLGLMQYIAYKRNQGPRLTVSWKKGKALLKQSYHYILSGMMVAIYGQTDKVMLKQMLNEEAVGYYAMAVTICGMWTFVLTAIIDSLYPSIIKSFKQSEEMFAKKNRQLYAIVFYISVTVSIVFVLFGDFAIKILYGEKYAPAGTPLKIITWYTAFSYFGVARNAWFVCYEKQKYLKHMYVFAALGNVILNYMLIPRWGSVGAATASLITQILTSIGLPYMFKELRPNARLMIEAILLKDVLPKRQKTNNS